MMPNLYLSCLEKGRVALQASLSPQAQAGEVIVSLTMCGICGTDTAKVFGDYPKPQKLGHEVVGRIHAVGAGVETFAVHDRVALAHHVPDPDSHYSRHGSETMDPQFKCSNIEPGGFAQLIRVPALHVGSTLFKLPAAMPDMRAVFMEPLACCIRALDRANLTPGTTALVVGAGAVGMLFMPLLAAHGIATIATDMRDERLDLAHHWGATATVLSGIGDTVAVTRQYTEGRGADAVFLTVVNDQTVAEGLAALRDGGTLVLFGGKPGGQHVLPLWDIWLREINVISSYSATPSGLARALDLLLQPQFEDIESLISHSAPLNEAQAAFELVHRALASKVVITP